VSAGAVGLAESIVGLGDELVEVREDRQIDVPLQRGPKNVRRLPRLAPGEVEAGKVAIAQREAERRGVDRALEGPYRADRVVPGEQGEGLGVGGDALLAGLGRAPGPGGRGVGGPRGKRRIAGAEGRLGERRAV
jgi:hypothetical protein